MIPHILKVAYIFFVCPAQSASVERGFSLYNIIKTKLRTRLLFTTLDCYMRIKLSVRQVDMYGYDLSTAARVFSMSSKRSSVKPETLQTLHKACNAPGAVPDCLFDGVNVDVDLDRLDKADEPSPPEDVEEEVDADVDRVLATLDVGEDGGGVGCQTAGDERHSRFL